MKGMREPWSKDCCLMTLRTYSSEDHSSQPFPDQPHPTRLQQEEVFEELPQEMCWGREACLKGVGREKMAKEEVGVNDLG